MMIMLTVAIYAATKVFEVINRTNPIVNTINVPNAIDSD